MALSPDGHTLLTGSSDGTAQLWNAGTRLPIGLPLRHEAAVTSVAFSPDGTKALTGSDDRTARLWDVGTGKPIGEPLRHPAPVKTVTFSPNGRSVFTTVRLDLVRGQDGPDGYLWDPATGRPIGEPLAYVAPLYCETGLKLKLQLQSDGSAQLYDSPNNGASPVGQPLHDAAEVLCDQVSPDGRMVLTGSRNQTARLWDVVTSRPIGPPLSFAAPVRGVRFYRDGRRALIADREVNYSDYAAAESNAPVIWDLPTPVEGDVKRIVLWVQVLTALELDAKGKVSHLDADTWKQRSQRLEELGGSPMP